MSTWREGDIIPVDVYERAMFDLRIAKDIENLKNPKKPPELPLFPAGRCGDGVIASFKLIAELKKYAVPMPALKRSWWR